MKPGKSYCPKRGDIVWLCFNPQSGHEQAGMRPAITISPFEYNKKTNLAIFCPITSKINGYPFEVPIYIKNKINGVILSDQVKSLDWQSRKSKLITKAETNEIEKTLANINILIDSSG
jgi:mRNA interferase MazF